MPVPPTPVVAVPTLPASRPVADARLDLNGCNDDDAESEESREQNARHHGPSRGAVSTCCTAPPPAGSARPASAATANLCPAAVATHIAIASVTMRRTTAPTNSQRRTWPRSDDTRTVTYRQGSTTGSVGVWTAARSSWSCTGPAPSSWSTSPMPEPPEPCAMRALPRSQRPAAGMRPPSAVATQRAT